MSLINEAIKNMESLQKQQNTLPKFGGICKACKSIRKAIIVGICCLPLLPFVIISLIILQYGVFILRQYDTFKRRRN